MFIKRLDNIVKYASKLWRPLLMWVLIVIVIMAFIISPVFGFEYIIPDRMYDIIELCFSIFLGGRTVEKIAPVIAAIKMKKASSTVDEADELSEEDNAAI